VSRGHVNAHTHMYSALAPLGMPAPDPAPRSFRELLERTWWKLDRSLDAECLRAGARLYVAEALLAGTSGLIDHHESPGLIEGSLDLLADACQELGMRAVLCYGASERNAGREEARRGLAECRRFIERNERPLLRGVVGLHAGFTVGDDTLREAGALARELGTVVHVHVAEDMCDVEDARARGYAGVLERLLKAEALPEGSILAHGVQLDEREMRRCAERGLWIVQNPRSNRSNGVGYPRALHAAGRVALGTDGFEADMRLECAALREHGEDPARIQARLDAGHDLFEAFFADALPGHPIEVEVAEGSVTIASRPLVRSGRLTSADLEQIRTTADEQARLLWKRMAMA